MVEDHTAGSPQQGIVWTNIKPREIAEKITAAGQEVSRNIARQLMKDNGFVLRQSQKKKSYRQHPNRQQQFEHIRQLKMKYIAENNPVISIDTKKNWLVTFIVPVNSIQKKPLRYGTMISRVTPVAKSFPMVSMT